MYKIKTVYFDMDGVLADFDNFVLERTGFYGNQYEQLIGRNEFSKFIQRHIKESNMYQRLAPMRDIKYAKELIRRLTEMGFNVEILSATGKHDSDEVAAQKTVWLEKMGISQLVNKINFVQTSLEKAGFADETTLLIDDREKAVKPFIDAGGYAILHTNFVTTIYELNILLKDIKNEF